MIVDLKRHKIIDLLPDRETFSVERWLKARANIKIVTRDRFSRYVKGVTEALPKATQVADRWHLIKNMGDALKKMLERNRQVIKITARQTIMRSTTVLSDNTQIAKLTTEPLSRRQSQMNDIKQLYKDGVPSGV